MYAHQVAGIIRNLLFREFWLLILINGILYSNNEWLLQLRLTLYLLSIFRYLHVTGDQFGRPIHGQREVSGYAYPDHNNEWKAAVSTVHQQDMPTQGLTKHQKS